MQINRGTQYNMSGGGSLGSRGGIWFGKHPPPVEDIRDNHLISSNGDPQISLMFLLTVTFGWKSWSHVTSVVIATKKTILPSMGQRGTELLLT